MKSTEQSRVTFGKLVAQLSGICSLCSAGLRIDSFDENGAEVSHDQNEVSRDWELIVMERYLAYVRDVPNFLVCLLKQQFSRFPDSSRVYTGRLPTQACVLG